MQLNLLPVEKEYEIQNGVNQLSKLNSHTFKDVVLFYSTYNIK